MVFNMKPIFSGRERGRERLLTLITHNIKPVCRIMLCYVIKCDVSLKNKEVHNVFIRTLVAYTL